MLKTLLRTHGLNLFLLALLPAVLFPQTLFQGKQLATHDILQWRAGAQSLIEHEAATGEQALWATDMFGGMPAYPITNVAPMPSLDSWVNILGRAVFPWLYYFALLLGAYVLALTLGASPVAALFGAVLIGFTTYIPVIIGAGHYTKFYAYVWTPWMLAGFARVLRGDRLLGGFWFAFFLSLQVRAGHPQVTYYFLFLLAAWWLTETIAKVRSGETRTALLDTGILVLGGLTALASILPQTLALNGYAVHSIRGGSALAESGAGGGLDIDYAFTWSQGWGELLTLVVPGLFGGAGETYWGPKPGTSGPHYFGALGALFLVAAVVTKPGRLEKSFLAASVLGILFSLGGHFMALNGFMFQHFPLFDKFRTPEMWLMLTCLGLAVPAALGFDRALQAAPKAGLRPVWIGAGTAAGIGLVLFLSLGSAVDFRRTGEREAYMEQLAQANGVTMDDPRVAQAVDNFLNTQVIPAREDAARTDVLRYLAFVVLGGGLWWAVRTGRLQPRAAGYAVVILAAVDLVQVGGRYVPESAFIDKLGDPGTVLASRTRPVDRWLAENTATAEGWSWRVLPVAEGPFSNAVPSFHYASLGGYSGAKLSVIQDFFDEGLFAGPVGINRAGLSLLNVRYITVNQQGELPGFVWRFESDGLQVYERTDVAPKAWFVDSVRVVAGPREAMDWLKADPADWRTTAVVEGVDAVETAPADTAVARVTHYDAHRIIVETERSASGFLVLSEIWYPDGWTATIDGVPADLVKTNYLLRGIAVPAGAHVVELRFEPDWLWSKPVGLAANLVLLLGFLGAGAWRLRKTD